MLDADMSAGAASQPEVLRDVRRSPTAYLRTRVMTAGPEELRLLLFDGALRFAAIARDAIAARSPEQSYEGLTRCQAILLELINSLSAEHDPELCRNLSALYTFMYSRLIDAGIERKPEIVDEVIELLRFERETWVMLMDKLASENRDASRAAPVAGSSISIQG